MVWKEKNLSQSSAQSLETSLGIALPTYIHEKFLMTRTSNPFVSLNTYT
jgi:hypothetical protein